jgi:protein-serine/threonine kinase
MVNAPGPGPDATETAQAEGEGPDGADSRPLQSEQHPPTLNKAPSAAQTAKPMSSAQPKLTVQPATPAPSAPPSSVPSMNGGSVPPTRPPTVRNLSTSGSGGGVGLPSPDTRTFPKEPGLTHADLAARSPAPTPSRAPSQSGASARSASSLSPASSISDGEWSQPPTPIIPSTVPPTAPPSRRPSIFRRASGSKSNKDDPTAPKRSASVKSSEGGHKFTLKDLLASGPKLGRRSSQRSVSSQKSDSDGKSAAGDSTASLLKKYGVCEKVAIGKGATSVVRLAHKWDRTEEKLYAVKVRALRLSRLRVLTV